jgi:exodeoxyribonuclease VII large subunit
MTRAHPRRRLNEVTQRVDDLHGAFSRAMREALNRARVNQSHLATRFTRCRPHTRIAEARPSVERQQARLAELAHRLLQARADRLTAASARLRLLGPEQVLARGYSITTDAVTGQLIRSSIQTRVGQRLRTRLSDSSVMSRVEE